MRPHWTSERAAALREVADRQVVVWPAGHPHRQGWAWGGSGGDMAEPWLDALDALLHAGLIAVARDGDHTTGDPVVLTPTGGERLTEWNRRAVAA